MKRFVQFFSKKLLIMVVLSFSFAGCIPTASIQKQKMTSQENETIKDVQSAVGAVTNAIQRKDVGEKFCPICGRHYSGHLQRCPRCGVPLEKVK